MPGANGKRHANGFASDRDVEKFVVALPDDYLECRELGHLWRPATASRLPNRGGFERTLRCGRCPARRTDYISLGGERNQKPHIQYPEGYLATGMGRIAGHGRDIIRLESVHRLVDRGAPVPLRRVRG